MVELDVSPVVETQRLRLRPVARRDGAWIAGFAADRDVARMTTRMPHPYGRADAEAFVEQAMRQDPRAARTFAVERRGGGPIGMLGFHPNAQGRPEIGYWLGRPHWGQGYATEAARGALRWARDEWKARLVVAGHFSDNPASGQVLCKADFLYTGEVRLERSLARDAEAPVRKMVWLA